jgi:pimeloyl-ACP methyl ester carboxylesterase
MNKAAPVLQQRTNKSMRCCGQAGFSILSVALFVTPASSQASASWRDPSSHVVRFVTVEKGVRLEVLDWGGSGTPVVLLAGGGNTAHVFDEFAPKLTSNHHVYGITRRGFGASGFSTSENPLDRLRDDVLTVIGALKLKRPVLVGHSIAGAELSAVATSHPDRIAGLVYIDAAYPYAFESANGPGMKEFQISGPRAPRPSGADLASFSSLQEWDAEVYGYRRPESEIRQTWDSDSSGRPRKERDSPGAQSFMAIMTSTSKFTKIPVPVLAIFASPHTPENWIAKSTNPAVREEGSAYYTAINASTERQTRAFEAGVPTARVVRLRGAHHIFLSDEPDTLREMRAFLVNLK